MVLRNKKLMARLLVTGLVCLLTAQVLAGEFNLHRRVLKAVRSQFGDDHVITSLVPDKTDTASLALMNPGDIIHTVSMGGESVGYLLSTQAKGRFESFNYSVIYEKDLSVIEVIVTSYRSSHGTGICQKGWLKQFKGYQGGLLQLGIDIDAVTGGTISSASLVADIQRCHLLLTKMVR